jgi:glycosyltransferase involved in cell wall biosynthesis
LPYQAKNVRVRPVKPAGGDSLFEKAGLLLRVPGWAKAIRQEMKEADAIHVRCPASISWVALLMLFLSKQPRPRWVKYAGNWQPSGHDRLPYRLQRWLLRRSGHGAVVTVNGKWPDQPNHVIPFQNPCLRAKEIEEGRKCAREKSLGSPVTIVHIGALIEGKGAEVAIRAMSRLSNQAPGFVLEIVGDGPLRLDLERLVDELKLGDQVRFHGFLLRSQIPSVLRQAHFLLHPSRSEGFPKVLAEGMAYGVVPIAGAVSAIPQFFDESGSGVAVDPDDDEAFARAVLGFSSDEESWTNTVKNGLESAQLFSYDEYLMNVVALFKTRMDTSLMGIASPAISDS